MSRCVCFPYCQNTQYFYCSNLSQKAVLVCRCVLSKYDVYILSKKRGHSFPLCLCSNLSKYIVCVLSHPVTEVCVQKAVWCPAVSMFLSVKIHSTSTAPSCLRRLCGVLMCLYSSLSKYTVLLLIQPVRERCRKCSAVSMFLLF